jgi:hypothetical protein
VSIVFRLVIISLFSIFVVSCGGGSTNTGNTSGALSIKIYDLNIEPLNNARVMLHEEDKKIIKEFIQVGLDGRADFGVIDSDKVTITASYDNVIITFVDVTPGDFELVMPVGSNLNPSPSNPNCYRIEYSFSDGVSPISANYFSTVSWVNGGSLHSAGATEQCKKQNDNTLSALAFLSNPDSYGYVLDMPVTDPTIFDVVIDKASSPITWSAGDLSNARVKLIGSRKDISYTVAVPPWDTSQYLSFANEFPVDFYQILMLGDGLNQHFVAHYQILEELPSHINTPQINQQFFDLNYQESSRQFQWMFTGNPVPQYLSIYMMTNIGYTWEIYLPSDASSLVVPDAPSGLLSQFGVSEIIPVSASISAISDTGINSHQAMLFKLSMRADGVNIPRQITSSSVNVLSPPPLTPIDRYTGPQPINVDVQAYMDTVWNELIPVSQCDNCHNTEAANIYPYFLDTRDINAAYSQALPFVDFNSPADSLLVTKIGNGHNCGTDCANIASLLVDQITAWNNAR